jgi:mono/diheme cytochrome c family protein
MKPLRSILNITLCTLALCASQAYATKETSAQALAHGQKLVEQNCTKCHGDEVYTRADHRVKSLAALGKQVRRCKDNIGIQLFDEDVNDIIKYLNTKYYKF